jgi:hypothetical protein
VNKTAFERGKQAASFYTKLRNTAKLSNDACIQWAKRQGLPTVSGRLVVPVCVSLFLVLAVLSGLVIGAILLLLATFSYMIASIVLNKNDSNDAPITNNDGPEFRNGRNGYGYYYGSDDSIFTPSTTNDDDD